MDTSSNFNLNVYLKVDEVLLEGSRSTTSHSFKISSTYDKRSAAFFLGLQRQDFRKLCHSFFFYRITYCKFKFSSVTFETFIELVLGANCSSCGKDETYKNVSKCCKSFAKKTNFQYWYLKIGFVHGVIFVFAF